MFRAIGRGTRPIQWGKVIRNWPTGLAVFIGQKTLFKTRPFVGMIHAIVAWGFTLYMAVNLVDVLYGMIPGFHFLPNNIIGDIYRFFVDIFSILVLVGVKYFIFRRFIYNDKQLTVNEPVLLSESARKGLRQDSLFVGIFILCHVGFRFIGASFEVALNGHDWSQPAATILSFVWGWFDMAEGALVVGEHLSWWLALGLILAFIPYFPYSKHAHLFMGPLNFMARENRSSPAVLEAIDFENEDLEQYGASKLEHLAQSQILDGYACIMCNRCQDACPAYVTGKELSPSAIEINKRYFLNENLDAFANGQDIGEPMSKWMLTEEAAWSCTTCGFCVEVCPVGNEPMVDILRIRQDLVMMESRFPEDAMETFNKLENYGNPWGLSPQEREKWMEGLDVPLMRDKKSADVLYWAGCAGAYDNRGKDISRAVSQILDKAGVDYACLGNEETCTGDSARRIGNEYLFQMMAQQNIEKFEEYGIKKIVTQCPHCLTTLKDDYAELGAELEVLHHSQYIDALIQEGKISPESKLNEDVTYHDACYLGRHQGEYDAPRNLIQSVLGEGKLVEMDRNKASGFCCGAGGGNMWYEINTGDRINHERFKEAADTNASIVATACNFCNIMMEDGLKVGGHDDTMKVKDISELVLDGLE
ncbi:MAG: (Fe-S)-binding protein [Candidatus Marinimicrobia bacterium]|nr:(Fe-S)-binding protein [Candidatus Neomarinimicrobiota bacterium]MBT3691797.1 (Fe-S)-binding protein [Candidatus Neomarinimicrobiota bacterium]MBT3731986.1 (Fe-S)-binding protein [Candidatus Neomarinimicrobiota bacterium]MBT4143881.1 (Fe-S)-binding protein [Candidatus Neomarinimicrobiota bacterium]MBT4176834.1 (Fe-S)-binding protein [Candidatus Neomarinimicrobiota bacterium]